jgi:hypothetical protein
MICSKSNSYKKGAYGMIKKVLTLALVAMLSIGALGGCRSAGEATGEAAQEVEEGARDFKEGYEKGKDK